MKSIVLGFTIFLIFFFFTSQKVFGQKVESGDFHSLVLCDDSTVSAWGDNMYGELGNGAFEAKSVPVQTRVLSGVTAITAGQFTTIALKRDSTVWMWGNNNMGQLGDGTTTVRSTPVKVSVLTGIIAIGGGWMHSIALKSDGTVWAWGDNSYGELGDSTMINSSIPVKVKGLNNIISISCTGTHSLALKNDGTVWAWGDNGNGELGLGSAATSGCKCKAAPVQVRSFVGGNIIGIGTGWYYSFAIKNDSTVWAWGWNGSGQLGNGNTSDQYTPTQINGLNGIISVRGSFWHSIALKNDGTVWTWGSSPYGQLGNGSYRANYFPSMVNGITGISEISAGAYHCVVRDWRVNLWGWCSNNLGHLGDGGASSGCYCETSPVIITSSCQNIAVPLQILSLKAEHVNGEVLLSWQVIGENGVKHYRIEKSTNGTTFQQLGTIKSCENYEIKSSYSFTDTNRGTELTYYRIVQVYQDGHEEYSQWVELKIHQLGQLLINKGSNPISSGEMINLQYLASHDENLQITIRDAIGNKVFIQSFFCYQGATNIGIPTISLSSGFYYLTTGEEATFGLKLIIR